MYLYYFSSDSTDSPDLQGVVTFSSFFILFNTLIPISIMITLEFVKAIQIFNINKDKLLCEEPEEKVNVLSMKLHEDLGAVGYIFSDKTGTLTKNEMRFKACSVFTRLFSESTINDDKKGNNESTKEKEKQVFSTNFDKNIIIQSFLSDEIEVMGGEEFG